MYLSLLLLELIILFLSSKAVIRHISHALFSLTKSKKWTTYGLAFIFFPGTVVHELAHLFSALLLGVPTGKLEIFPKFEGGLSSEKQEVTLGSVEIAKTDVFRRFIIGAAPLLVGLGIIFWVLGYVGGDIGEIKEIWKIGIGAYVLFMVTNTMFSSKRDMEGMVPFAAAIVCIAVLFYISGIRLPEEVVIKMQEIAERGATLLLVPLGINTLFVIIGTLLQRR